MQDVPAVSVVRDLDDQCACARLAHVRSVETVYLVEPAGRPEINLPPGIVVAAGVKAEPPGQFALRCTGGIVGVRPVRQRTLRADAVRGDVAAM